METQVIYIRPYKKATIDKNTLVRIKDIADVYAPPSLKVKVEGLPVLNIPEPTKKAHYLITIITIIKVIINNCNDVQVQNVGEMDVVIDYTPKAIKTNNLLEWLKVTAVSIVVFAGATIAIMTYNTDVSLAKTFTTLNKIFTGKEVDNPILITIPYSLGIALGVVIFFNHIGKKKITDDPTPMQVEMSQYETGVEESIADNMNDRRRGEP